MAGQGKRRKLEDAESLLHTGGISIQGLAQIMKIVKKIRLTKETSFDDKVLSAANSVRSVVMFEHMQHFGTSVFNTSQNHVIHC